MAYFAAPFLYLFKILHYLPSYEENPCHIFIFLYNVREQFINQVFQTFLS